MSNLKKIQEEENLKNEARTFLNFSQNGECPYCEGYGEVFDSSDLQEPHKECEYCFGSGEYYEDDVCCYDPTYTGPKGYCHCAEYQKEFERQQRWQWKVKDFFLTIAWRVKQQYRKLFPKQLYLECDHCHNQSNITKYYHTCEHCGGFICPF